MPNSPRTQHRSVRIGDLLWDGGEVATAEMGTDRAKVINEFMAWYERFPGAKLPERPSAEVAARAREEAETRERTREEARVRKARAAS